MFSRGTIFAYLLPDRQVLGHLKLVVILLVGVAGFGERSSPTRLGGMTLALGGIITYTMLKQGLGSGWEGRRGGGGGTVGSRRIPSGENLSRKKSNGGRIAVSDNGKLNEISLRRRSRAN